MTWVRLDDSLPRHPKLIGLASGVKWSYVEALCYCGQYNTDGLFPAGVVDPKSLSALLAAGLVEDTADGYVIHDFLDYNPSKQDLDEQRGKKRAAGRAGGRAAATARASAPSTPVASPTGEAKSNPDPTRPVPQLQVRSKTLVQRTTEFTEFWAAYPRKQDKREAQKVFARLLKDGVPPLTIIEGARRFAADPNRDDAYTKLPTTWLNHGCWDDDPQPARTNGKGPDRATQIMRRAMETREAERAAE